MAAPATATTPALGRLDLGDSVLHFNGGRGKDIVADTMGYSHTPGTANYREIVRAQKSGTPYVGFTFSKTR